MVGITIKRWYGFRPVYTVGDRNAELKVRIGHLTLRRALRLETTFFVCQLARLIHTVYMIFIIRDVIDGPAALERSFVTFMLMYLSVADLITRQRIARKIDILYPDPDLAPLI